MLYNGVIRTICLGRRDVKHGDLRQYLKHLPRAGWLLLGVPQPETEAEPFSPRWPAWPGVRHDHEPETKTPPRRLRRRCGACVRLGRGQGVGNWLRTNLSNIVSGRQRRIISAPRPSMPTT